jgi:centrosomal protein CEP104
VPGFHELPVPEELQEEQFSISQQSGLLGLLGEYRARCAVSKVFALRDACLVKLRLMLQTASRELPPLFECIPPLAALLNQTLDDKIHQVIARSVSLLEDLLRLAASSRLASAATASHLDPLLTKLIHKLEDGNARTRDVALRGVDAFITSPYFGPRVVTSHALRPLDRQQLKGHAWRPLVARMRLLRDIVANFGINNEETGATTETVMRFPKEHGCFSHSNGDVRDAAKELTTAVESVVGVHALEPFMRELRPRQLEEYHAAFETAAKVDKFKGLGSRKINKPSVRSFLPSFLPPFTSPFLYSSPVPDMSLTTLLLLLLLFNQPTNPPTLQVLTPRTHTKKAGVASGGQVQTSAVRSLEREGVTDQGGDEYCQCMFCGASDPGWNEDALDLHYWKDCTFLTPCPACAQVVEIAGLADHLLDECEHRGLYINCEVTGLAVREDDYADFQRSEQYRAAPEEHFYCPLCYQACPDNDAAWKRHISMQCAQNTRI